MRTLSFIINGQIIQQDPKCDFSGLVPGSEQFLKAKFTFSPEWRNCTKVIAFFGRLGNEYPPCLLKDGVSCVIPTEAVNAKYFKIQAIGKRKDGFTLRTSKIEVCQNGG